MATRRIPITFDYIQEEAREETLHNFRTRMPLSCTSEIIS